VYIAVRSDFRPAAAIMIRCDHPHHAFVFCRGHGSHVWLLVATASRWSAASTSKSQATKVLPTGRLYAFLRRDLPKVLGHNQLAATAYLALFGLLLIETITGFALDGIGGAQPAATIFGWLSDFLGPQLLRLVHHLCMWAILAIAIFHIYSCVLVDHLEKNGLMSSIFSGYKVPTREEVLESRDGGAELLEELE
jgi:Ni/Fe-hydrogenase b-type cytochrome subunit